MNWPKQKFKDVFGTIGGTILVIVIWVVILFLFIFFINSIVSIYSSDMVLNWASVLDHWVFSLSLLLLFLCIFPRCRIWAGIATVYCSYFLALILWLDSLLYTYIIFGSVGALIGIGLAGIGIYFTSLIALLWIHAWLELLWFVLTGLFILGIRTAGIYIATKEEDRRNKLYSDILDTNEIVEQIVDSDNAPSKGENLVETTDLQKAFIEALREAKEETDKE